MDSYGPLTLRIGRHAVDLRHPTADQIDLDALEANLDKTLRWTSHPDSLSVRQHQIGVAALAELGRASPRVIEWCRHHDDHEGIIGDITGPVLALIADETPVLARLANRLDNAICEARCISRPSAGVRQEVHFYDKLCATLEWLYVLNMERTPWCYNLPAWLDAEEARGLMIHCKGS